ncbi:hypothetical protein A2W48_00130 [Candidatus Giovannonibacteria bacterium RIFCSPHIGHO2_12_44_12]|uniref:Uncharacterized protein n=4 Tax=Candidatus Giovannoniibacteriota TaxID=1752738 RepID=A0A1F5X1L0_9BACT|nr:MAG: hypothetical protein UX06_C0048G0002 [Candidatus Giovannonibacteria bacterium GW2011_GWA2_45_21]OGF73513.1 MAG: hypothetical protein A2W57_03410 [Candidatus Giovannonibacteria bacterium RIFCSPHIGHO2_02_43_16]OGF81772.1 MAG: hypothetical protein A2W48_00130 [Candidatus Giovannonibacteria bacterium RIFCSPHIGHO2_12_44_12]OGF85423.1 MAG: hypothetical protein A2Z63_00645 [Candidatus Giovannonibacteria bacterium RIFCSPLOWO2_02_44_8]
MNHDNVFRQMVVLAIMAELFASNGGDKSFIFKINDEITGLIAGILMGIKRSRRLSVELIREVSSNRSQEAMCLADHLIQKTKDFGEEQSAREVQAMLWLALQEVHNRFRKRVYGKI